MQCRAVVGGGAFEALNYNMESNSMIKNKGYNHCKHRWSEERGLKANNVRRLQFKFSEVTLDCHCARSNVVGVPKGPASKGFEVRVAESGRP